MPPFSLKVGMGVQRGLSLSSTVHKTHTNWVSLKSLMPIRSSLYLLSLCNSRINLHTAGSWGIQGRIVLRKALFEFVLFWQSLSCVRGHIAVFQMLFLWNLSSEKSAAGNVSHGAPRSFHHIPQSLAVNTTKTLPGCIQTSRSPVPNSFLVFRFPAYKWGR